jgi:hypothetical protein
MVEAGQIKELQEAASRIGHSLLVVGHYPFGASDSRFNTDLQMIGRELHLLETECVHMDGVRWTPIVRQPEPLLKV